MSASDNQSLQSVRSEWPRTAGQKVRICLFVAYRSDSVCSNVRFLRGSLVVLRCIRSSLIRCLEWREQQGQNCQQGDASFLNDLVAELEGIVGTMRDMVTLNFQERMTLNTLQSSKRNGGRRGWKNELLAVTYGEQYARRRSLSRKEAQFIPYVTHEIEQIREFLMEKWCVHIVLCFESSHVILSAAFTTCTRRRRNVLRSRTMSCLVPLVCAVLLHNV